MVQLMIGGLQAKDSQFLREGHQLFHVNSRFSNDLESIGKIQISKLFRLLGYCMQAWWYRFAHGADTFYYIPAPGLRAAVYRDWIVMLLCRPVFRKRIFHWHATGLNDWLRGRARKWELWLTRRLISGADVSIVLSENLSADALAFKTKSMRQVPNGIPDPCPDFEQSVLPDRRVRLEGRKQALNQAKGSEPEIYQVLFLGNCIREKGIFEAANAVTIANQKLQDRDCNLRIRLTVAGDFLRIDDEREFQVLARSSEKDLNWIGFVSGKAKAELLRQSDCLCFPSYYWAEGQPVSILEAMAYGLGIVTTNWRAIPEMLPAGVSAVEVGNADAVASALLEGVTTDVSIKMRENFLHRFSIETHLRGLASAFNSIDR